MQKLPDDIQPTHEYRFTRTIKMQFNSVYYVVRIYNNERLVQDWMVPSVTIDLSKFELLPHPPSDMKQFNEHFIRLRQAGDIPSFMAKWRQRLPADEYLLLLEDIRALVLFAEMDLAREVKTAVGDPTIKIVEIVSKF